MSPLHETLACDQCYTTPCTHNPTQTNTDTRWQRLKTELARDADHAEQTIDEVADDEQSRRRWVQTRTRIQALRTVINRMNQIEQETD